MPTVQEILQQAKVLSDQGRWDACLRALVKGLQSHPNDWLLAQNAARAALFGQRYQDSKELALRAISLQPMQTQSRNALANACISLGQFQEAAAAFRASIEIDPNDFGGHLGLSAVLEQCVELETAIHHAQRAIELDPTRPEGYANMSFRLRDLGDLDGAIAILEEAERHSPGDFENHLARVSYLNYSSRYDAQAIFQEHLKLGRRIAPVEKVAPNWTQTFDPDRKLRVGILSADLRTHSVAFFIEPLLRHYDRNEWHLTAYADCSESDAFSKRARGMVDQWKQIGGKPDPEFSAIALKDKLDVLIELNGWTLGQRLPLLSLRLAPIQIDYLGYPNTTGVEAMDYRIVDEITDPLGSESLATERLIRLPGGMHCYQPPPQTPDVASLPAIKNGFVTFGSFNTLMKVTPEVLATWAEILRRVPNAQLIIKTVMLKHPLAQKRVTELLQSAGADMARVRLMPNTDDPQAHLAMYGELDLALDTFPYNGTTTTCDSMWMGVPVIGFAGDRHAARVTASLMHRVGLGQMIGQSREEMIELAVEWAGRLDELAAIRAGLRGQMEASPLRDEQRFAREIQDEIRGAWQDWCRGN